MLRRKVYFSFDHKNDLWRAMTLINATRQVVRAHLALVNNRESQDVVKSRILDSLERTSVTIVLIGSETFKQPWVHYELQESAARGNGLLGIYIHQIKDLQGNICISGARPVLPNGTCCSCYDWDMDLKRFQNEVKASAQRAYLQRRSRQHFPSLGW